MTPLKERKTGLITSLPEKTTIMLVRASLIRSDSGSKIRESTYESKLVSGTFFGFQNPLIRDSLRVDLIEDCFQFISVFSRTFDIFPKLFREKPINSDPEK